ncbi:MAG: endo-1,4-beta-xylanase [Treponema sp.]|nr:endo-1,4-beta-xylanase [Treponema sp.]MCL2252526.1 endo-1,4-beta-xylanase [Treponema sp.]
MKKINIILTSVLLFTVISVFTGCISKDIEHKSTQETVSILDLPPLKDQFADYFMIGNIFHNGTSQRQGGFSSDVPSGSSTVTNKRLTHHYNVLTHENELKPSSISPNRNAATGAISYNWETADRMVNAAIASGFKVVGHTLLWHSQIPKWQQEMANESKETALAAMRQYITDVAGRYSGKIYSWDVLNEVFPDGMNAGNNWQTVMRNENPWFKAIGADFVYEGFLAARKADPHALLYYNDYNLNNRGKAAMVHNMVRDLNARYKQAYPNETRLLIEGIGMQSHHNIDVTALSIQNSISLFRPLGVKISISELDILSQGWSDYSGNIRPSEGGKAAAAGLYGAYFMVFLENSDIIERVTFWGVFDQQSWRARALPQIFEDPIITGAKPAYFKIIEALEKYKSEKGSN